jgi:hypothetical protein
MPPPIRCAAGRGKQPWRDQQPVRRRRRRLDTIAMS